MNATIEQGITTVSKVVNKLIPLLIIFLLFLVLAKLAVWSSERQQAKELASEQQHITVLGGNNER